MKVNINVAQQNSNEAPRVYFNRGIARPYPAFKRRLPKILPALLISVVALMAYGTTFAQTTPSPANAAPSDAQKAFEKMKSFAGTWHGSILGIPINLTIRVASSGTAILHEANGEKPGPPSHEITMFYVDGDRLLATHYCDAGNRARLEGKLSPDGNTIEFNLLDVAGSSHGGLVKHMAFTTVDANKHIVEFTFVLPERKPMQLRGEFQRTN